MVAVGCPLVVHPARPPLVLERVVEGQDPHAEPGDQRVSPPGLGVGADRGRPGGDRGAGGRDDDRSGRPLAGGWRSYEPPSRHPPGTRYCGCSAASEAFVASCSLIIARAVLCERPRWTPIWTPLW